MIKGQSPYRGSSFAEWLAPRVQIVAAGYQSPCWLWKLTTDPKGYARWRLPTVLGGGTRTVAMHREAYKHLRGEIPEGMVIDHLCRNRSCQNPDHLEPVTAAENTRRGINQFVVRNACAAGHPYTAESCRTNARGHRICRICKRANLRAFRERARTSQDIGPNEDRTLTGKVVALKVAA